MTTLPPSLLNQIRREKADKAWRLLLNEALRRGFHGSAAIEVKINDGMIQHIHRRLEQMDK